ncbi:MAG: M12 family metallo-peptidase, partial [Planctomycetota bacterium]
MKIDWRRSLPRARPVAFLFACASLAACSGGGGGSSTPAVSFSFSTAAGNVSEGAAPLSMTVVLHTTLTALTAQASIDVFDSGLGTATSGSDYASFAPATVTFPIGSIEGDSQIVNFSALDDHSIEGAGETVRFGMQNAMGGVAAGMATLTATIADVNFATIQFVLASSATPDESTAPRTLSVQLDLPPATTLDVAASVRVSDAGGGSATSAVDYSAMAPTTINFPAGSADNASQTVAVGVIDDAIVEVDETVRLSLSMPSIGVVIGGTNLHQLTITDDDSSAAAALIASEGPTGVENAVAYDTLLNLGTQTVGAGPNAGTLLRISNAGGSPMDLGAPSLTGTNPTDFDVTVESAPLQPPPAPGEAGFVLAQDVPPPWNSLESSSGPGLQIALDSNRMRELAALTRATISGFPVPGLGDLTLDLHRLPLPIAANAVLRVDGIDVPGGLQAALGDLSVWSGNVLEHPGSHAFLALSSEGARGYLELPFKTDRFVHLITDNGPGVDGTPAVCRVVRAPELAAMGFSEPSFFCGGEREVPGAPRQSNPAPMNSPAPPSGALTTADCKLAIETDFQLYQKFNSTPAATTYVTQLMAAISDQYFTDVQTTLSIAYLGIYTSAGDPWTSQDSGGNSSSLLDEFKTAWTSGGWPVQANLAHFISGANLGGGVAYLNVLCNQGFGFGVSGNINGTINWGSWTGAPGNFTWDFVVVAHEIGHNFGSQHTHSFCPPLDQ